LTRNLRLCDIIQGVLLLLQAAAVRRTTVNSTCPSSRAINTQRRQVCYVVTWKLTDQPADHN